MAEHTPGPWTAHDDDGTGTLPCVLSDRVNAGGNFYVAQSNRFADAQLMAAAPELLRALEDLVPLARAAMHEANAGNGEYETEEELGDALTAIKKAEEVAHAGV
jgi:hypothetical protein